MSYVTLEIHKSEGDMKVSPLDRLKAKIINWLLPKQVVIRIKDGTNS